MVWYSHLFQNFSQFIVIHTVRCFNVVNEAEVYVFLEFSYFLYDPVDVGNLISGSAAFLKSSLYIWKFSVTYCWSLGWRILCIMWNECNCAGEGNSNSHQYSCLKNPMDEGAWYATVHGVMKSHAWLSDFTSLLNVLWHCLSLGLEWKLTFSSPVAAAVSQTCWHIECSTSTASSFRI